MGAFGVLFEPALLKLDPDEDGVPEDCVDALSIHWKMHCERGWMALLCAPTEAATWGLSSVIRKKILGYLALSSTNSGPSHLGHYPAI